MFFGELHICASDTNVIFNLKKNKKINKKIKNKKINKNKK